MKKMVLIVFLLFCLPAHAGQWQPVDNLGGSIRAEKIVGTPPLLNPAVSPDGKYIAYVSHWTSIWVADANGGNAREIVGLTDSLNILAHPRWSPDGVFLVYTAGVGHSDSGGKTSIWRVAISGGEPEQLFAKEKFRGAWNTYVTWSHDGSKIAVNALGEEEVQKLLVLDTSNNKVAEVAPSLAISGRPEWAIDSKNVIVQAEAHEKGNLWLVSVEDGSHLPIDSGGVQASYPSYSADGRWILFQGPTDSEQVNPHYIIPAEGGALIALPGNEISNFSLSKIDWNVDGESIFATASSIPWTAGPTMIAVVDTSGDNFRVVVENDVPMGMAFQRLAWSPDETQIAYTVAAATDTSVYSVKLNSLMSKKIARGKSPTWSPYMDEVAFARDGNIWVKNVETDLESQVTLNLEGADNPQWSPVGDMICFQEQGLWLVPSLGGEPKLLARLGGSFNWSADGTTGWGHNNRTNDYNGIWGDTWEYPIRDAPEAGRTWGGCEGHFARVVPDGSYVISFHGFQGSGIIIQKPNEETGRVVFKQHNGLMPVVPVASPSGTRIAFLLLEPFVSEVWKIDISELVADRIVP